MTLRTSPLTEPERGDSENKENMRIKKESQFCYILVDVLQLIIAANKPGRLCQGHEPQEKTGDQWPRIDTKRYPTTTLDH
jgi:hypothetical protein